MSRSAEKNHVSNHYPHGVGFGWVQVPEYDFSAMNCMKFVGVHRKIMFLTLLLFGSEVGVQGLDL